MTFVVRRPGFQHARYVWLSSSVFALVCVPALAIQCRAENPIQLHDATQETGISFQHNDGHSGQRYIIENVSAGLALFDYDDDGKLDIYLLNGGALPGTKMKVPPRNVLYRNLGDWKFVDVTDQAGVGNSDHSLGTAAADYDNDGDLDLYVSNYGPNALYRNNGDGTFTDVTLQAGVADGNKVGAGVCFLDIDADGWLDLFVANYIRFSYESHRPRTRAGIPVYPGPLEYEPEPDTLFRNNGDGTFTDVSVESGIAAVAGTGMGVVCSDYDHDGDTDILVGNDVMANFLYQNDGSGKFEEVALFSGIAFDIGGIPQGSMGVDCGDYDNDGGFDFHVTTASRELSTLYRNEGDGMFTDVTRPSGAGRGTFRHVAWGNSFVDLDNDGDRDLFIACGHFDDNADLRDDTTSYMVRNVLLMNTGDGKFLDVSQSSGDGMAVKLSSRGAAFDDLDNDGDIDAVILNSRREPTILRNETRTQHHWIQIELEGAKANRDGIGARVQVVAGDLVQVDEVHSGRGYQSHFGMRLHFGLRNHQQVDRIEVEWIGGGTDVVHHVPIDQRVTIVEGSNQARISN